MNSLFLDFVTKHAPQNPLMPFIHSTCGLYFQDILFNGSITKIECPVFHEEYIYLFYGRPAYKVSAHVDSCSLEELLPVSFLLKPDAITNVKKIYPFDSGAYQNGNYKQVITTNYNIDEFNLGDSILEVQKLITAFFGNNKNYYYGKSIFDTENPSCLQAIAYHRLIETQIPIPADDRKYTAEIIVNYDIELINNLIAIILPRQLMKISAIKEMIEKNKFEHFLYSTVNGFVPSSYNYEIFKIAHDILEDKGYF